METNTGTACRAAISRSPSWETAVREVLEGSELPGSEPPDLALLFASYHHRGAYEEIVRAVAAGSSAQLLAGCSGQGIIGPSVEVEAAPAMSLLQLRSGGGSFSAHYVRNDDLEGTTAGTDLAELLGLDPSSVHAWIVLADPFRIDIDRFVSLLEDGYAGVPVVGGLASAAPNQQSTCVFLDGAVFEEGVIAIAVGGMLDVRTVVSQGATPIGEPWTITGAHANFLETIGGRPAYEVLVETVQRLPDEVRQRALSNILVGLAMDEYRDTHARGDFLIRNLIGVDRETGALAVSAYPRAGQTVQFQMRDRRAADEELVEMLRAEREALGGRRPAAALLCSCNGRGVGLFGVPNHDAQRIEEALGDVPLAGFFCNGEIGPVGGKTFLHGFTASLALLLPPAAPQEP